MYYYGGYPGNFLLMTPEFALIIERFIDPNITFLSFSYVPVVYLEWIREQLKNTRSYSARHDKNVYGYIKSNGF